MDKVKPKWAILIAFVTFLTEASCQNGEFVAGSFILTQKALSEAPYRYSKFLTTALEKMELQDPPTKRDEENCNVRYRIEPSGRRHDINPRRDSLKINLLENNTVVISAKVDVAVHARTWIWKGVNFGFLGCMKITSCGGQVVTYKGKIDMKVSFQVFWNEEEKRIHVKIRPVDTVLSDVNVLGCRPPWYLWWFKSWQEMLNAGVQGAFQEFADTYSHSLAIPTEMVLHNNTFISYKVTNLIWSKHFVAFEATSTFKALINGRNITYIPNEASKTFNSTSSIPIGQWPQSSASDHQSNLLQGVRLSGYFLNAVMWYASVTNATEYHGNTTVLDSQVNGTINYTPPILTVSQEGVLNITIPHGLLLATCKPTDEIVVKPATLFKAEFSQLAGSGRIKLAAGKRTGIIVEIESLDLSILKTKPFEPKLPLPLTFESELMKTGILQLKPIINQYLKVKPIFLPEDITPIVAYPEVFLNQTLDGLGYAQILSYCTCSDFQAPGSFSKCDDRSRLCKPRGNKRKRRSSSKEIETGNHIDMEDKDIEYDYPQTEDEHLPEFAKFLNGSKTFHKISDKVNDFLEGFFVDKNKTRSTTAPPEVLDEEDEMLITKTKSILLDTRWLYLTQFETSVNCSLGVAGDKAKSYRLTPKSYCSPILAGNRKAKTSQYYVFKPDGSRVLFGCFDKHCKTCTFDVDISEKDRCIPMENNGQSFVVSHEKKITEKILSENNGTSAITIFFNDKNTCEVSEDNEDTDGPLAEMLSDTYELGNENDGCIEMASAEGYLEVNAVRPNSTNFNVRLRCNGEYSLTGMITCTHCSFNASNVETGECEPYFEGLIKYSKSEIKIPQYIFQEKEEEERILITLLAVFLSVTLVLLILVAAACCWCLQVGKGGDRRIKRHWTKIKEKLSSFVKCLGDKFKVFAKTHIGLRFCSWKTEEKRNILEDVVQNLFLLTNGICAILFAFEWNSPNNPLLLFSTKMSSKMGFGSKILEMSAVQQFSTTLNFYTYMVNIVNGAIAFLIVLLWCFSKSGSRQRWTKLRLMSSSSMLSSILLTIACVIFTTYFDDLVQLKTNSGYFITDNAKMRNISEGILKVSLNGLSLTVISFTIVFLFHGVGGGLYSGTVLFRILHLYSKKENLEILTTLLVILTIIQPFICLHPVIIWSQDSNHNAKYLILTIFVWFLPLAVHLVMKLILSGITNRYKNYQNEKDKSIQAELAPLKKKKEKNISSKTSLVSNRKDKVTPSGSNKTSQKLMTIVDVAMQVTQLTLFLTTFSFVTHHIINTELDSEKQNLKNFVLPAIISVFMWMMSISYFLLDLVMNATKDTTPLVFRDKNIARAKNELQASLRRRLVLMEKRGTLGTVRNGVTRPTRPPPPPPPQSKSRQISGTKDQPAKSTTLPPLYLKGKNQIEPRLPKSGSSVRIKIKEIKETNLDAPENEEIVTDKTSLDKSIGSIDIEDVEYVENNASFCSKVLNYILERQEYSYPETHGWRIKFRRIFLQLGVFGFTFTTYDTLISTQSFSSKKEIQKMLNLIGTNLTWPDEGSALDDVFELYNETQQRKSYVMIAASVLFWTSLILDFTSYWSERRNTKTLCVIGSRVVNFIGSLFVFASVILVGLPDYLEASNLDEICPYCGSDFNKTVKQVAEFSIGLFFACLFTFQLLPVLMTIAPALVRASVLILIHPGLRKQDKTTVLRMSILQQVIIVSSLLSFPITFVSMCIVDQHQKDSVVSVLIILFWTLPPLTLYVGLHYSRTYRKYSILLFVYYLYNCVYVGLVLALVLYSFQLEQFLRIVRDLLETPAVWFGTMAQVFLCNVVISDLLYMTVF
jgi:hypothetical protein